jgi:DNA helicase II / ATP-dependent DNA helicase PcrA
VDHKGGPLLISAGPGTGKTRTITCRMAALMQAGGVPADQILAVTFTNKAAGEMRHRLADMLSPGAPVPLVATFHGLGWRLLQELYDDQPGAILDEAGRRMVLEDALSMVLPDRDKAACGSLDKVLDRIIQAKQLLLGPEDDLGPVADGDCRTSALAAAYAAYQQLLAIQDLYDFEDLLMRVVLILERDKPLRRKLRRRYTHIFVDEFQDINYAQYRLLRALAPDDADLCVIGDPDQAIYGFRGSDVRYFRQFKQDFSHARTIRLTRNYRSTETILASAFQVIQGAPAGPEQHGQARVYSDIQGMGTLTILETASERAEAVAIGRTIEQMVGGIGFHSLDFDKLEDSGTQKECSFNDFAVLCRTGDQARRISRQLADAGIPCQLAHRSILRQPAVTRLLAVLRLVAGQGTYADLTHITGLTSPGISKETLTIFKQWVYARRLPLATALRSVHRLPVPGMSIARQQRLTTLLRLLERLEEDCGPLSVAGMLGHIVSRTTLASQVQPDDLERLRELAGPFGGDTAGFAASLALQKDTDLYRPDVQQVAVMTLHAAKGLEFPVVFIAGCEDNVLPLHRPGNSVVDIDEERRLFYVGLTRARQELFLTWSRKRTLYGQTRQQHLSPFVADIEESLKSHRASQAKPQKPSQEQLSLF